MSAAAVPTPNPEIIAWSHRESGFTVAEVAKRLNVKEPQVVAWQSGEKSPTFRQLKMLAGFYRRPFSLFYQSAVPRVAPLAGEYRRLRGVAPGKESPQLRVAIRQMMGWRETALDLAEELGYELPDFGIAVHVAEDHAALGRRIRSLLGVTVEAQLGWRDAWVAWREWREAMENAGLLVFMFPNVELSEVRGMALPRRPLPVVGVNTKEGVESRAFTALHELVHLALANASEEGSSLTDQRSSDEWEKVEAFAESVASHVLIDEDAMRNVVSREGTPKELTAMRRQASRFKVAPLAYATRLWRSGVLSGAEYGRWLESWNAHLRTLPQRQGGFATPVDKTVSRAGRGFAQLVLEALDTNSISMADASHYLNLRTEHFDKLRAKLFGGETAEGHDE